MAGASATIVLDANDSFAMSVELGNGALGVIHATRWGTGYANTLRLDIFGSRGALQMITDRQDLMAGALRRQRR